MIRYIIYDKPSTQALFSSSHLQKSHQSSRGLSCYWIFVFLF